MSELETLLETLQTKLGIHFHDIALLREALTHTSYVNENPGVVSSDNERLEFLGDAVLDFLVGEELFRRFPTAREGELTSMRAALVQTDSLAQAARDLHLSDYVLIGKGEEFSGGRQRPANLCGTIEAIIGAAYLDQGLETSRHIMRFVLAERLDTIGGGKGPRDAKSQLQERVQGRLHHTPAYRTVLETGPDHAKEFIVEVYVGDTVLGRGRGNSKQSAEMAAARDGLANPIISEEPELEGNPENDTPGEASN